MAALTSSQLANKALTEAMTLPAAVELVKDMGSLRETGCWGQAIGRTGPAAAEIRTKLANSAVTEASAFWKVLVTDMMFLPLS